jgi:large subunit ribosomal protein L17
VPVAAEREPEPVAAAASRARAVPTAVAPVATVAAPARTVVPGAVASLADGSAPDPAYAVKGKVATKTFHTPGSTYYTRTRADVWFRTARDARAAGFTERVRRQG